MPTKAGKTNAEAREESRKKLLRAGAELLGEEARRDPFGALRVRDICAAAGYSTGAFYVHWDEAVQYYAALADYLLSLDLAAEDFAHILEARDTASADSPPRELLERIAAADLEALLSKKAWDANELLNITWARTTFRDVAARGYREIDELTGETYGAVLANMGREPRPPLTMMQIGTILQALVEGFGLRSKVDRSAVLLPNDEALNLYAVAVNAVLAVVTRRSGDPADINDVLDETFAPTPKLRADR